jgi:hypothetical protein
MLALTLPSDERRAHVTSFWCLLGGVVTLFCVLAASWLHVPMFATCLAIIFVGVAALALIRPHFAGRVYRAWNRRIANPFARRAANIVTKIAFFMVFLAVGKATRPRNFPDAGHTSTQWIPRESLSPTAYGALYAAPGAWRNGGWIAEYVRWARRTGNLWSVSLLPYFVLLMLLHRDEETAAPANIYTLF